MASSSSSSSSSCNSLHDVFISFSEKDVSKTFISHLLSAFDRKLISAFKNNEIERSRSLNPKLKETIRDSRIAIIVFSKSYPSRSCLNELLEIMICKEELDQLVIPIFYGLDPSHVRKQSGDFEDDFKETCKNSTEDEINRWSLSLIGAANLAGYHICKWQNEAKIIEEIADDVLSKLLLTPCKDFDCFVGMDDHITEMSLLLRLKLKKVRMVGIWGPSGVGKTTIARALYSRIYQRFQKHIFIDSSFISKSLKYYRRANPDDYNMKLHLQKCFLSMLLGQEDIEIDELGAVRERLNHMKVLIVFDDLNDHVVLQALAGQIHWFGSGSRIIVITENMHILRVHRIRKIHKVDLPSKELAHEIFCRYAFGQSFPPDGFERFAYEVAGLAGGLPLGLNVLGSYIRAKDKKDWMGLLPSLRNKLNGTIDKTLRVGYDGLESKEDKEIFRYIACLFSGMRINEVKELLAHSDLEVNFGLKNLVDKSLIQVRCNNVEMHHLLREMGKEIVRMQSIEPGQREFIINPMDVYDVLDDNTGTKKTKGILLDMDEIDELYVHEGSFKEMTNLHYLNIHMSLRKSAEEVIFHLSEDFDYLPSNLRFLSWDNIPAKIMPSQFCPKNLVNLQMQNSKLEKLWDGVAPLTCLKYINLSGSKSLKQIADLSMATNLDLLDITDCWSLRNLPSSMKNLCKLRGLRMSRCRSLKTLPIGINLKSLDFISAMGCSRLIIFPNISTNISHLYLCDTGIKELSSNASIENPTDCHTQGNKSDNEAWEQLTMSMLPSSIACLTRLRHLTMKGCKIETFPSGINLESLDFLNLAGCSRLREFPNISKNPSTIYLSQTAIKEVPSWIDSLTRLRHLSMIYCNKLKRISPNISKLKHLDIAEFSNCGALTEHDWLDCPSGIEMETDNVQPKLPISEEASSSSTTKNSSKLGQEAIFQQQSFLRYMILPGEQLPSYFTHQDTTSSLLEIPLSKRVRGFRACIVLDVEAMSKKDYCIGIQVQCCFKDSHGNHFDFTDHRNVYTYFGMSSSHLCIFDCHFSLDEKNAPLAKLKYKQVDIKFHLCRTTCSKIKMKQCGIRFSEDRLSPQLVRQLVRRAKVITTYCKCNPETTVHASSKLVESNKKKKQERRRLVTKK